ncbi:hypothetical protein JW960_00565 [candidate division KSB1 bacterium]|nr:hypothetical protein [candidate division KSB1 bacterium]
MTNIPVIIDWFGPYSRDEAIDAAKNDYIDGLYMLIGKTKYQKQKACPQYIGLSDNLFRRLSNGHNAINQLSQELKLWLAENGSPGIPGRKLKKTNIGLDLAEWAHTFFMELPLNDKKTMKPPDNPVLVVNRWWKTDYETRRNKRPHCDWPDIIDYLGAEYGATVAWNGRNVERWNPEDF